MARSRKGQFHPTKIGLKPEEKLMREYGVEKRLSKPVTRATGKIKKAKVTKQQRPLLGLL